VSGVCVRESFLCLFARLRYASFVTKKEGLHGVG
jgi:hypothetical protein